MFTNVQALGAIDHSLYPETATRENALKGSTFRFLVDEPPMSRAVPSDASEVKLEIGCSSTVSKVMLTATYLKLAEVRSTSTNMICIRRTVV